MIDPRVGNVVRISGEFNESEDPFDNHPLIDECPKDLLSEWECKVTVAAIDLTAAMAELGCSSRDIEKAMDMLMALAERNGVHMFTCENGVKVTMVVHDGKIDVDTDPPAYFD